MGRVFSQKDGLFVRLWAWLQELPHYIWPKPIESAPLTAEELAMLEVDDKVEAWHNSDSSLLLHEYLGWTFDEYRAYVERNVIPARNIK